MIANGKECGRRGETVAAWATRVGAGWIGRLPERVYLPADDPRAARWPTARVDPIPDEATARMRGFRPLDAADREPTPVTMSRRRHRAVALGPIRRRLAAPSDAELERFLVDEGHVWIRGVLDPAACDALTERFPDHDAFARTIDMAPKGYGVGRYRYFHEPLPEPARTLRAELYRRAVPLANALFPTPKTGSFPVDLEAFWSRCREHGQQRTSTILLRYELGGVNHPHRDVYGPVAFPLQAAVVLSRRGRDFDGGELVLLEEGADGREIERRIPADQGDVVLFPSAQRPRPTDGRRRGVPLRHGMTPITRGERYVLGVVFHLAE